jgi:hypothetical protein
VHSLKLTRSKTIIIFIPIVHHINRVTTSECHLFGIGGIAVYSLERTLCIRVESLRRRVQYQIVVLIAAALKSME